jgi:hypothetical protein
VEEAEEEVMEDEAHVAPEDLLAEEQKLMEERRNAQEQAQVSITHYVLRGLSGMAGLPHGARRTNPFSRAFGFLPHWWSGRWSSKCPVLAGRLSYSTNNHTTS